MFLKQYCIPPKKKNKLFLKFFLCDKFRFELHFYSNIIIIFLSQCFLLFGNEIFLFKSVTELDITYLVVQIKYRLQPNFDSILK